MWLGLQRRGVFPRNRITRRRQCILGGGGSVADLAIPDCVSAVFKDFCSSGVALFSRIVEPVGDIVSGTIA